MWGDIAISLIKELDRCPESSIPPFDDDKIRLILEEMRVLNQFVERMMDSTFGSESSGHWAGITARQAALERNKRCLLAYQQNRISRLSEMRWEFGSTLPADIKANLSEGEIQWFNKYCKLLANYMKSIGGENGLNLMLDMQPPKELYIEVRCIQDHGMFELDTGEVFILARNSQHLMPRSQCEPLIRQGILMQID